MTDLELRGTPTRRPSWFVERALDDRARELLRNDDSKGVRALVRDGDSWIEELVFDEYDANST
ncbi:MAG TPA: hypothetical protein VG755_35290 [Nannocystaceae bacterium]|nr:hypothetical protein [Nannocystaceae bacterium]